MVLSRLSRLNVTAKATLAILVTMVCVIGVLVAASVTTSRAQLVAQATKEAQSQTSLLADGIAGAVRWGRAEVAQKTLDSFLEGREATILAVVSRGAEGAVLTQHGDAAGLTAGAGAGAGADAGALVSEQQITLSADTIQVVSPVRATPDGDVLGELAMVWSLEAVNAKVSAKAQEALLLGMALAAGAAIVLWFLLRWIIGKPLGRIQQAMGSLAEGQKEVSVPFLSKRDDVGAMAQAVQVFKEHLQQMDTLKQAREEADAQQAATRRALMETLRQSVGDVVEAAARGDFSQRISHQFDDPELAQLGDGVNRLVSAVDAGLSQVQDVVAGFAQADLTRRMSGPTEGAFADLQCNINQMADQLQQLITRVHHASDAVNGATSDLSIGAEDLANRTTQQASSLEQTAASVEQLTAMVQANAKSARLVADQVQKFSQTATKGGAVMGETRTAMDRISASSGKINEIIGLIDGIAFQTNLLALNASVEAARAGEAGKGFAVVASEVRRLAQSASEASTEVSRLISASASEVEAGNALVTEVTEHLQEIVNAIGETQTTVNTMAASNQDQATSLQELSIALRHLDDMTQQNASMAEQTRTAVASTLGQTEDLSRVVSGFKVA